MAQSPEISNPTRWFHAGSKDAEWWCNGGTTREECIAAARANEHEWIAECKRMVPNLGGAIDAEIVIENIQNQECWGEDGWEGFDEDELQKRLDETIAKWFVECCTLDGAQLEFVTQPEKIDLVISEENKS